jgi:OFA family oxalate/formate antiporter-like MFS transporter
MDLKPGLTATPNRWGIAFAGVALQLALGTVYAWSYFQDRLMEAYGWDNRQVALTFSLAILFLGVSAAVGGMLLARVGPRKLAMLGGALFGAGYLAGAVGLHWHSLAALYLGYGVIGGTGLGLGYVTPIATVAKWFPDRKGLVTGMVVMGFGFGALLMSKVLVPTLLAWTGGDWVRVFAALGILFLVWTLPMGFLLRNPPAGYAPPGWTPPAPAAGGAAALAAERTAKQCIFSGRFLIMWVVFFCNIAAGIAIITFQSPLMQDLWSKADPSLAGLDAKARKDALAAVGATLIACSSLFNGFGRFGWGGLSDRIGRTGAFRIMLASQAVVFVALIFTPSPWLFGIMVCYILLCYGGGFGTMPSFVLDVFGAKRMAAVYGAILTAWAAAGVAGPVLFAAVRDHFGKARTEEAATWSFLIAAGLLAVGTVLSFLLSHRPHEESVAKQQAK